jgi:hypothetical protein
LFETVKTGDKRLVGYAVDYGTRVSSSFESGTSTVRELHVKNGILEQRTAQLQTRTYTIRNTDNKPKVLIIEHVADPNTRVLSPVPRERSADANRYEIRVGANKTEKLLVKQEYLTSSVTAVADATPVFLLELVQNKTLGPAELQQLHAIARVKQRIADWNSALALARSQENDLNADQNRWRQNIMSLNRVPGQQEQVARYSSQLAASDAELNRLRTNIRDLQQKIDTASNEMRGQIATLDF